MIAARTPIVSVLMFIRHRKQERLIRFRCAVLTDRLDVTGWGSGIG